MLDTPLRELVWAWQDTPVEAQIQALLGQRELLEELQPGLHKYLKQQQDEAAALAKARAEIPRRIATIKSRLKAKANRDGIADRRLAATRTKLAKAIARNTPLTSQPSPIPTIEIRSASINYIQPALALEVK